MDWEKLEKEVTVKHSRASGAGGQHVNKVATRVELSIAPAQSDAFSETEKNRIAKNLADKISKEGFLTVSSQESRSQLRNKRAAWEKLKAIITKAIKPPRPKRKASAFKANRQKRLESKSRRSEIKKMRSKVDF